MHLIVKRLPHLLALGATLMLPGCQQTPEQRNAGLYDMGRETARRDCFKLGRPELIDECSRRTQVPYDEYNQRRNQLRNAPPASSPTDMSKPINCFRRSPTDEITCTN